MGATTLRLPEVALTPDQAPEAAQLVASLLDQVSVDVAPLVTLTGLALIDTVVAWAAYAANDSAMRGSTTLRNSAHKLPIHRDDISFCMVFFPKHMVGTLRFMRPTYQSAQVLDRIKQSNVVANISGTDDQLCQSR